MKYIKLWEEKYSLLLLDFISKASVDYKNIIGNDNEDSFIYMEKDGVAHAHCSEATLKRTEKKHGEYLLDHKNSTKILGHYQDILGRYPKILKKVKDRNLKLANNKKLADAFRNYANFAIEVVAYFRVARPEMEIGPNRELKKLLLKYYKDDKKVQSAFNIITTSTKIDPVKKEEADWLKLLGKRNVSDKAFLNHGLKYPWLFVGVYSENEVISILVKKYKHDFKELKNLKEKHKKTILWLKSIKKQQKTIFSQCKNNKNIIYLAKVFQNFSVERFYLKSIWCGTELKALCFFDEIAKRIDISVYDLLESYTFSDIIYFLENNIKLSSEEVRRRKRISAIIVKDKKVSIISGEKAKKFIKKSSLENEKENKIEDLKGVVANPGIARGPVKIIDALGIEELQRQAKLKNFRKGDILVTTFTQPNMVFLVNKTAGIITDMGGITSHAAVISREFGIPCIVGTRHATKVLKDGDMIEIDANMGTIKLINK